MRTLLLSLLALVTLAAGAPRASAAGFGVEGAQFVVTQASGERLTSADLVGAVFEIADGQGGLLKVRIDAVAAAHERPGVLLHSFSVADPAKGGWRPLCDPDAYGRAAGFPVRGRWDGRTFIADPNAWFLACSSGSNGKCVLWGYDPWGQTPDGRPLAPFYQACQQMVRADYAGKGEPHTRNGTTIDTADIAGIQTHATLADKGFAFEAGWGLKGAVCVARTRWPDLLTRDALLAADPELGGRCDEASARARGALLFTRVQAR
jgi:hypothetical protein